jgi:hypothetical protein
MPVLEPEQVEEALTRWATGDASTSQLAFKYGVSQQILQYHLKKATRVHINGITTQMWAFHKEFHAPFPIRIPRAEAFHENAAFHYGQWLLDQFKKLEMNVIVQPFQDPQSGDIVFGLVDVDFMAQLEKEGEDW